MSGLKYVGLSIAVALALGLGGEAKAAPVINSRAAIEVSGVADGLIVKIQGLAIDNFQDNWQNRVMSQQNRRVSRQVYRQNRRINRRASWRYRGYR